MILICILVAFSLHRSIFSNEMECVQGKYSLFDHAILACNLIFQWPSRANDDHMLCVFNASILYRMCKTIEICLSRGKIRTQTVTVFDQHNESSCWYNGSQLIVYTHRWITAITVYCYITVSSGVIHWVDALQTVSNDWQFIAIDQIYVICKIEISRARRSMVI